MTNVVPFKKQPPDDDEAYPLPIDSGTAYLSWDSYGRPTIETIRHAGESWGEATARIENRAKQLEEEALWLRNLLARVERDQP